MDQVIHFLRTRAWARRTLSGLSALLVIAAVALLSYPLYTNVYQHRVQNRLKGQIASPQLKSAYQNHTLKEGDSLTRIKIPKIGVDVVVVQGTSASALRAGAGHYTDTPLPCDEGNVAIAGHRTTYGKPFANIDQLKPGDTITLTTPIGECTYEVAQDPFVILPNDFSVVANTPGKHTLTLTACHPKGSASHRIVIKAREITPTASPA